MLDHVAGHELVHWRLVNVERICLRWLISAARMNAPAIAHLKDCSTTKVAPLSHDEQQTPAEPDFHTDENSQADDWNPWLEEEKRVERWPLPTHYVWLAFCVGLCLINAGVEIVSRGYFGNPGFGAVVFHFFVSALSSGMSLFGLGLFVVRRMGNVNFPKLEGEFLLLATGINFAFFFVFNRLPELFIGSDASLSSTDSYHFIRIIPVAISSIVMLFCFRRATFPWRLFILLLILRNISTACLSFNSELISSDNGWMMFYLSALHVPTLAMAVVALFDLPRKRELSWTHWLGIGAFLVGSGVTSLIQGWDMVLPYFRALLQMF